MSEWIQYMEAWSFNAIIIGTALWVILRVVEKALDIIWKIRFLDRESQEQE